MAAEVNTGSAAGASVAVTEASLKLEATRFTNKTGEFADFYFTNNPWKISPSGNSRKVYKYCVVCAKERFSKEKWADLTKYLGFEPLLYCYTYACNKSGELIQNVVPRNHWSVITQFDCTQTKANKFQEYFEKEVVSVADFDRETYDKKLRTEYFTYQASQL